MSSWSSVGSPLSARKSWPQHERVRPAKALLRLSLSVLWATRALHNHYFGQRARRRFGRRGRTEG